MTFSLLPGRWITLRFAFWWISLLKIVILYRLVSCIFIIYFIGLTSFLFFIILHFNSLSYHFNIIFSNYLMPLAGTHLRRREKSPRSWNWSWIRSFLRKLYFFLLLWSCRRLIQNDHFSPNKLPNGIFSNWSLSIVQFLPEILKGRFKVSSVLHF